MTSSPHGSLDDEHPLDATGRSDLPLSPTDSIAPPRGQSSASTSGGPSRDWKRPGSSSSWATTENTNGHSQHRLKWGAGLRAQTTYSEGTWLQVGLDAVVYPHKSLGLGVTALQGARLRTSTCDSSDNESCSPYWRTVVPFVEARLTPLSWVSPYLRGSIGVAWGRLDDSTKAERATALATRSELGLDLHRNASVRVYVAYERFEGSHISLGGLGGGLQLGLTL
ncbi:MAG: hypothetical protein QM784_02900 [Polyangiaceae bacterium]